MRKSVLSILMMASIGAVSGQLKNSSWTGYYNLPDPVSSVLSFGTDTVTLSTAGGDVVETMTFRMSNDTLFLKKVSGGSTCDTDTEAVYQVKFKENKLFLLAISDDCDMRRYSFPENGATKIEQ